MREIEGKRGKIPLVSVVALISHCCTNMESTASNVVLLRYGGILILLLVSVLTVVPFTPGDGSLRALTLCLTGDFIVSFSAFTSFLSIDFSSRIDTLVVEFTVSDSRSSCLRSGFVSFEGGGVWFDAARGSVLHLVPLLVRGIYSVF